MRRRTSRNWCIVIFILGLAIITLELDRSTPMSETMHHLDIILAMLFLLIAGAASIYQHAQVASDDNNWWDDDDWSHWGGI